MKNFAKLFRFIKPYKKWAILAPLLIILEVIMDLFMPSIIASVVNVGLGEHNSGYIVVCILLMIGLTIMGIVGGTLSAYYAAKTSQTVAADLRKSIFEKISKLSFFHLDQMKTGHFITVLTNDITLIGNIIMMGLRFVFRVPIILIGSTIMAIMISGRLSLILILIIPIMLVFVIHFLKKAFPYFQIIQEQFDGVNSVVRENLGGIRVVKAFVTEEAEKKRFDQVNRKLTDTMVKATRIITVVMPIMMLSINLATVLVLWFGGGQVVYGTMKIGNVMAFIQYLTNILTSLLMASMVIVMLSRSEASAERINSIFDLKDDFKNKEAPLTTPPLKGKIEFRGVSFSYTGGSGDAVLRNLNFTINPGETLAILGSTGSGKSSLVHLIPRFYEVSSGQILIDDIDIKDYDLAFLRNHVGISLQQSILFADTVFNNVKYGKETATLEEVKKACSVSCASTFIEEKEDGYETHVEQRGTNFSGGQKQRLSIARAILPSPDILILDDSTSAVDMKTEQEIRRNLKQYLESKTTIIVAQRVSAAISADRVLIIDDGQIVGLGTHAELLKTNEIYQDIYASQLGSGVAK